MSAVERAFAELRGLDVRMGEMAFVFDRISAMAVKTCRHQLLIDPADYFGARETDYLGKIDIMLITHEHYDHFNASRTLEILKGSGAAVLCNPGAYDILRGRIPKEKLTLLEPAKTVDVAGVKVSAVESIHPGRKPLMCIVDADGVGFFHGSDSGYTSALEGYRGKARVAFVPVGAPSPTASVEDGFRMLKALGSKIAVPIHGSRDEVARFKEKLNKELREVTLIVPEPLKTYKA